MSEDRRQQPDRRAPGRDGGRRAADPQPDWLSIRRYALTYGVDRATVCKWLRSDILVTYRVDRVVRVRNLPPDQHRALKRMADNG